MTIPSSDENYSEMPIADAIDIGILMHRDAHFGGRFDDMLEYYAEGGKGVSPDFDMARIRTLQELEKSMKSNLAAVMLSGTDAERVAQSKDMYKKLRTIYETTSKEITNPKIRYPVLIADLILAEEEYPEKEILAIAAEKNAIVPSLIELIRSENFYDPLFPGYGTAPALAIKCLGLIGDKRAIIALFESIGESDFFNEDIAIDALHAIGEPAKAFLLKVLHARPLNFDNERAAIALSPFRQDPEVAETCFKMLKEINTKQNIMLAEYLSLACEGLVSPESRKEFRALADNPNTSKSLAQDIRTIAAEWQT